MKTYKIKFALLSSIRTPFHADTFFGHLCWAMRLVEGNDKLKKWLDESEKSPTLVSNAFLIGKFPRPVLPSLPFESLSNLLGFDRESPPPEVTTCLKDVKKIQTIDESWLWEKQCDFSNKQLIKLLYNQSRKAMKATNGAAIPIYVKEPVTHNTYDRLLGRVSEGGLYEWEEEFYLNADKNPQEFWLLIRSETLDKSRIERLLGFIEASGYGADKSIGKGQITIQSVEDYKVPDCPNPNAFVSLSNFIPGKPEDLNGYYNPLTKYGKLGGIWASGYLPFKKPVVMLQAGAVIKDKQFSHSKLYGKLQKNVHGSNKDIRQYGYAFPIPIHLKEEDYGL